MLATLLAANPARAQVVEFAIDPNRSTLRASSTVLFGGMPLGSYLQGPDSDLAHCTGALVVELTSSTIRLAPGTILIAGNSGDWLPGTDYSRYPGDLDDPNGYVRTPAPANYGIVTDLTPLGAVIGVRGLSPSATRNLQITLIDAAAKALVCGEFDEGGTPTDFVSGTIYYSSGGSPPSTNMVSTISPALTASVADPAWLGKDGTTQVLTLPVSSLTTYFINFLVVQLRYEGTIVAVRDATGEFVAGDLNGDDQVDAADLAEFCACMTGPGAFVPPCECREADLDADRDADLLDFARLQRFANEP